MVFVLVCLDLAVGTDDHKNERETNIVASAWLIGKVTHVLFLWNTNPGGQFHLVGIYSITAGDGTQLVNMMKSMEYVLPVLLTRV